MSSTHEELHRAVRAASREMDAAAVQQFTSGVLVGLAMAALDTAACKEAHRALRAEWRLDPSMPSAEYAPEATAAVLLRAVRDHLLGDLLLPP